MTEISEFSKKSEINAEVIQSFKSRLETHPIYDAVKTLQDLRIFMQHHVYSVWDFMSLIKYLQNIIAPVQYPWVPQGDGNVRRFINELVLEEESDQTTSEKTFSSHFELYLTAMEEIGADTHCVKSFIETIQSNGIDAALNLDCVPAASRVFTRQTFDFIDSGKPHNVAAALALGREHIIPCMFRAILKYAGVTDQQAPVFHFYLNRHIHLDEDFHAPLSLKLLNGLCQSDAAKFSEAIAAAEVAVEARLTFWDGVLKQIQANPASQSGYG